MIMDLLLFEQFANAARLNAKFLAAQKIISRGLAATGTAATKMLPCIRYMQYP